MIIPIMIMGHQTLDTPDVNTTQQCQLHSSTLANPPNVSNIISVPKAGPTVVGINSDGGADGGDSSNKYMLL